MPELYSIEILILAIIALFVAVVWLIVRRF